MSETRDKLEVCVSLFDPVKSLKLLLLCFACRGVYGRYLFIEIVPPFLFVWLRGAASLFIKQQNMGREACPVHYWRDECGLILFFFAWAPGDFGLYLFFNSSFWQGKKKKGAVCHVKLLYRSVAAGIPALSTNKHRFCSSLREWNARTNNPTFLFVWERPSTAVSILIERGRPSSRGGGGGKRE